CSLRAYAPRNSQANRALSFLHPEAERGNPVHSHAVSGRTPQKILKRIEPSVFLHPEAERGNCPLTCNYRAYAPKNSQTNRALSFLHPEAERGNPTHSHAITGRTPREILKGLGFPRSASGCFRIESHGQTQTFPRTRSASASQRAAEPLLWLRQR